MPRAARVAIPGCAHHLTQRGNNRQPVFFVDDDRRVYLELLAEEPQRSEPTVAGYCLMTNHIHLVVTPSGQDSPAKAIGSTHLKYTRYINGLHGRCGHLWQDRFFSWAPDEGRYWEGMRYVERNAARAGLVRKPWRKSAAARGICGWRWRDGERRAARATRSARTRGRSSGWSGRPTRMRTARRPR